MESQVQSLTCWTRSDIGHRNIFCDFQTPIRIFVGIFPFWNGTFHVGQSLSLSPSRTTLLGKHSSNNSGYNFFRFLRSRSPEIEVLYLLSKFILLSCLRRFLMAIPTSQFLQRILAKRQ